MQDIKFVRLRSGEDLVVEGLVIDKGSNVFSFKNALILLPTQAGVAAREWCPYIIKDTRLTLPLDRLDFDGPPNDDVINAYKQAFSNIVTPPDKKLVTP